MSFYAFCISEKRETFALPNSNKNILKQKSNCEKEFLCEWYLFEQSKGVWANQSEWKFVGWSWTNEPCALPTHKTTISKYHFSPINIYIQNCELESHHYMRVLFSICSKYGKTGVNLMGKYLWFCEKYHY